VILQRRGNFSAKHLLWHGAISFTGLCCGTKFPLAVTASNGEAVHLQNWTRLWRVVRQPLEGILRRLVDRLGSYSGRHLVKTVQPTRS
jgi:hypothetical protein